MRALTLALAALLAVCAVPVGTMLLVAPDGHLLGASTAWLRPGLPFSTYLVPGLVLVTAIGGGAVAVIALVLRRSPAASLVTALLGVVVMVWIALQVAMVTQLSPLQAIIFAVGLALVAAGRAEAVWIRWVAANAAGELVGLGAVAAAVALVAPRAAHAPWFVPGVILLGGVEGFVVGAAQAWALRRAFPRVAARAWVVATVAGAITAWVLGMLPSLFLGSDGAAAEPIDDRLQLVLAAGLGMIAGPVLAAFQVAELRRHVRRAGWWLAANGVAWAAGMPVLFVAAGSGADPARAALFIAAAGAIVGAIHGLALLALARAPTQVLRRAGVAGAIPAAGA